VCKELQAARGKEYALTFQKSYRLGRISFFLYRSLHIPLQSVHVGGKGEKDEGK
jgi:hypothetical protein